MPNLGSSSTHLPEKSCGKICGLLGCYTASVGNSLLMFLDKLLVRYSCTKKEGGTNRRCLTSQKSADLIYFAAKNWNQAVEFIIFCARRKKFKYGVFNWVVCVTHHGGCFWKSMSLKTAKVQGGARNIIPLIVHITHFSYYKSIWHLVQN